MCCSSNRPTAIACIPTEDDGETLARIIKETIARRGKVIVPAFAIGRVEEFLYWLFKLEDEGRLAKLPIYVDSPMAIKGIAFYMRAHGRARQGNRQRCAASCRDSRRCNSASESKALVERDAPAVIIASSGMATGGRVVHHLFAGPAGPAQYRVVRRITRRAGTRGRQLVDGAQARQDVRATRAGPRQNREDRRHVVARRCR